MHLCSFFLAFSCCSACVYIMFYVCGYSTSYSWILNFVCLSVYVYVSVAFPFDDIVFYFSIDLLSKLNFITTMVIKEESSYHPSNLVWLHFVGTECALIGCSHGELGCLAEHVLVRCSSVYGSQSVCLSAPVTRDAIRPSVISTTWLCQWAMFVTVASLWWEQISS